MRRGRRKLYMHRQITKSEHNHQHVVVVVLACVGCARGGTKLLQRSPVWCVTLQCTFQGVLEIRDMIRIRV